MANVKVGDRVSTTATHNKNADGSDGIELAQRIRDGTWIVRQVGYGSYDNYTVLENDDGIIMCAVDADSCTVVNADSSTSPTPKASAVSFFESINSAEDAAKVSRGIEQGLKRLLENEYSKDVSKYSLRLFGVPHQFTNYCDYRTYTKGGTYAAESDYTKIGRGFMTNVMIESPVITFIPCKPYYLPNMKKNQLGLTAALIKGATAGDNGEIAAALNSEDIHTKLRYYDLKEDYEEYMKYVNLLCRASAGMLKLNKIEISTGSYSSELGSFDWRNYRWTETQYLGDLDQLSGGKFDPSKPGESIWSIVSGVFSFSWEKIKKSVSALGDKITGIWDYITGDSKNLDDFSTTNVFDNYKFVQFYCDAASGVSESADNQTGASKIEGIFDTASDLTKEIAFIGNSGGLEMEEFQNSVNEGTHKMLEKLQQTFDGNLSGLLGKMTSNVANIIKGDIMIFPEIYQNSKYTKNYTITIDLRTPYGSKLGYYLNVLVPLFHLICLAMPKQSTANTYAAPFLVKAYYPGVFSCNMGIVSSIQIDKNPSGDAWSLDGFPNEVKVTLNVIDLYSELSLTPAGSAQLFIGNSSLIEYICTNCGIDFVNPTQMSQASQYINVLAYGEIIPTMLETLGTTIGSAITTSIGNAFGVGSGMMI